MEFYDIIERLAERKLDSISATELFLEFSPVIQKFWIPSIDYRDRKQTRTKFNTVDDRLLLLGLIKYGSRKLSKIQENYLSNKTISEIKNRFKNLICSRAPGNMIKVWKILSCKDLDKAEKKNLKKGQKWFGENNYSLISRYFL